MTTNLKILLIAPFYEDYKYPIFMPSENLGLAYISSFLQEHSIPVDIYDAQMLGFDSKKLLSEKDISNYNIIGIGCSSYLLLEETMSLTNEIKIKYPKIHITVGGHFATFQHEELLKYNINIDSVVRGEGEETMLELVNAIAINDNLSKVKGLSYRHSSGEIVVNQDRPFLENLDRLPFPNRDTLIYIKEHGHTWPTQISTSRGCYANCTFCDIRAFYGIKWRGRSPVNVVDELEYLNKKFQSKKFRVSDDEFLGPKENGVERAIAIANEIIRRKIDIEIMISARANMVEVNLFKLLKKAGVVSCLIGVESAIDRILKLYHKGNQVEHNLKAIRILQELNINLNLAFIMFDPRMTFIELQQNYIFLKRNNIITPNSLKSYLAPFHGTTVYEELKSGGLLGPKTLGELTYKFKDQRVGSVFEFITQCKKLTYPLEKMVFEIKKSGRFNEKDLNEIRVTNKQMWTDIFEAALKNPEANEYSWVEDKIYQIFQLIKQYDSLKI